MTLPYFTTRLTAFSALLLLASVPAFAGEVSDDKNVVVPKKEPWQFTIEPYGWATGINGDTGAGGLTAPVDVSFGEIFDHLDWGLFLKTEARKGKWGVIFDGYFAELSADAEPRGPLYKDANLTMQQGLAQLTLAYRVIDNPRGYVDFFAGARYNYLSLDLNAAIDSGGIEKLSNNFSDRVVEGLVRRAELIALTDIELLKAQIEQGIETDLEKRLKAISAEIKDSNRELHPRLERDGAILRSVGDVARAVARQRAAVLQGAGAAELAQLEDDVKKAEKDLAKTVNKKIKNNLPKHAYGDEEWVDPIVGFRAQFNFNERFFATAYADIGGFGVASELTWQVSGSLGYNFNRSVFAEVGYRYLHTDYEDGGFTYDLATFGAFIGMGIKF